MIQVYDESQAYQYFPSVKDVNITEDGLTYVATRTKSGYHVKITGTCSYQSDRIKIFYAKCGASANKIIKFTTSISGSVDEVFFSRVWFDEEENENYYFVPDGLQEFELSIPYNSTESGVCFCVLGGKTVNEEIDVTMEKKSAMNLYTDIDRSDYYHVNQPYQGVSQNFYRREYCNYAKISGTSTQPEGSETRMNATYDLSEIGNHFRVVSTIESDRENVYFGMAGTVNGEQVIQYFPDGQSECEFAFPPGTTGIYFCFFCGGGVTANAEIGFNVESVKSNGHLYDSNGDMTLTPITATVHPILNGAWEAELQHPIDDMGRWKYIVEGNVVKMPSFNEDQLFRIKKVRKIDSGITATMEPIFMDALDDCYLTDIRPVLKTGQAALDMMTAPNTKYSGQSDITRQATAYYQDKNLIEAINGEDSNSFINRWGGEILFNNFVVIINNRVGGDYGVELRYGKNIPVDGLSEEVDINDVVTRIYPKAYNGHRLSGLGYVDSPNIGAYPMVKAATITFDDVKMAEDANEEEEEGVIVCQNQEELDAALTQRCNEQYEAGLDKPKVTIEADMVLLQNTRQYKDYQILEEVGLGDTVHCIHNRLWVDTEARVIELEYDSIRKKVSSVVLGDFKYNYFQNVSSSIGRIDGVIRPDGTLIAEQVSGILNGALTSLRAQYDIAQKQDVMALLFENLDATSPLYGALGIGTQGIQVSKSRTTDGRSWDWTTAITAAGIIANAIVTGRISDKDGESFWDLDNGQMNMKGSFSTYDNEGSYTTMDANGLMHHDGNTEESYHYLMETGTVTFENFDVNTYKSTKTIQLPDNFKGKSISFVPFPSAMIPIADSMADHYWSALSKLAYTHEIDEENATVTLTVECRYTLLGIRDGGDVYPNYYGTPISVDITYIAIA